MGDYFHVDKGNVNSLKEELEGNILGQTLGPPQSGIFLETTAVEINSPAAQYLSNPTSWHVKMQEKGTNRAYMVAIETFLSREKVDSMFDKYNMTRVN